MNWGGEESSRLKLLGGAGLLEVNPPLADFGGEAGEQSERQGQGTGSSGKW